MLDKIKYHKAYTASFVILFVIVVGSAITQQYAFIVPGLVALIYTAYKVVMAEDTKGV